MEKLPYRTTMITVDNKGDPYLSPDVLPGILNWRVVGDDFGQPIIEAEVDQQQDAAMRISPSVEAATLAVEAAILEAAAASDTKLDAPADSSIDPQPVDVKP